MAGKNNKGLPLDLNPNASTSLKKKVENNLPKTTVTKGASPTRSKDEIKKAYEEKTGNKVASTAKAPKVTNKMDMAGVSQGAVNKFNNKIKNMPKANNENSVMTKVKTKAEGKMVKGSKPKQTSNAKSTLKKAFNAADAMKQRRANAMANRDKNKNPNNINLRGIVKTNSKKRK